ncbi:serine hydrolase domain-containing protein [Gemmatimonas sp.]
MHRLALSRRLVLVALIFSVWSAAPRTTLAQSSALSAFVDSLERAGFSGTVLVADTQRTRLVRAMGFADRQRGRRITLDDRWRWASVSKQVTAALVLHEVDAGRLALDTPVVRYLPTFTGSGRERITVRQLLQHSSGLPNMDQGPTDSDGVPRVYRETKAPVGDAAFARVCDGPLAAAPGERFDYNNCDYLVLGAAARVYRTGGHCRAPWSLQGVQVRNVLLPERGLAVIIFANRADVEFGEVWQQTGLMFDALSRAVC